MKIKINNCSDKYINREGDVLDFPDSDDDDQYDHIYYLFGFDYIFRAAAIGFNVSWEDALQIIQDQDDVSHGSCYDDTEARDLYYILRDYLFFGRKNDKNIEITINWLEFVDIENYWGKLGVIL